MRLLHGDESRPPPVTVYPGQVLQRLTDPARSLLIDASRRGHRLLWVEEWITQRLKGENPVTIEFLAERSSTTRSREAKQSLCPRQTGDSLKQMVRLELQLGGGTAVLHVAKDERRPDPILITELSLLQKGW